MEQPNTNNGATTENEEVSIGFRTSAELKEKLQKLADKEVRSLSNYLNIVLTKVVADIEAAAA